MSLALLLVPDFALILFGFVLNRITDWGREFWGGLESYTRGYYFNTQIGDDQEKIRANFGANYDRLVKLKDRYDPNNLFRLNANVLPSRTAGTS